MQLKTFKKMIWESNKLLLIKISSMLDTFTNISIHNLYSKTFIINLILYYKRKSNIFIYIY
jgi:hypothetical protein